MVQAIDISHAEIQRALRIYWRHAWPDGAVLCPLLPDWSDLALPDILARFADEAAGSPHACGRYVLRLGNHLYPHMKFAIEQCVQGGGYYFLADCHDDESAPGVAAQAVWNDLRARNFEIKRAIESEWEKAGLPTFRTLSRHATVGFARAATRTGTILIVDNEPANAELTGAMLQAEGFGTEAVTSGADAIQRAALHRPDLVVSDYEMPGLSGREVAEQLKSDAGTRAIPVLICTYADLSAAQVRPADALLRRPFSQQDLTAAVGRLLRLRARQ